VGALGLLVGQRPRPGLEARRVHRVGEGRDGDRPALTLEGADGVCEVALGLAQVVRLGVDLAREDLVGQLGVRAVRRVVDPRTLRRPHPEGSPGLLGRALELVVQEPSPLGSMTTAPWPASISRPAIHAWVTVFRPRGADNQGVPAAGMPDRDPHGPPARVTADRQPVARHPASAVT
jgi:hypothetical protein